MLRDKAPEPAQIGEHVSSFRMASHHAFLFLFRERAEPLFVFLAGRNWTTLLRLDWGISIGFNRLPGNTRANVCNIAANGYRIVDAAPRTRPRDSERTLW